MIDGVDMDANHPKGGPSGRGFEIVSEFAAVRVTLDLNGRGPRLKVEDLESGAVTFLDPLELASFCLATEQQRKDWLEVGPYVPPTTEEPFEDETP